MMDLFNTLGTSLYPTTITEHNDDMSNLYNDEREERIAESVYEIVDNLSEPAARRLLEDILFTQGIDSEDFSWTLRTQTKFFIEQAEKAVA